MTVFFSIFSFVFGTLIGSFLNVVILRLPKEESLGGRSYCPNCKRELTALDLVPIFSYLFLRGKCRSCGHKISPRYITIELITGFAFLLTYLCLMPQEYSAIFLVFKFWIILAVLICVFVIDLEHFLILDSVILSGGILVIVLNLILDFFNRSIIFGMKSLLVSSILAALAACLPFFLIWYFSHGNWMGFGDVKLAIFLGLALGWPNIFVGLMVSVLLGGVVSTVLLATTSSTLKTKLPFGTFLSLGSVLTLFVGPVLLKWYLSILGF